MPSQSSTPNTKRSVNNKSTAALSSSTTKSSSSVRATKVPSSTLKTTQSSKGFTVGSSSSFDSWSNYRDKNSISLVRRKFRKAIQSSKSYWNGKGSRRLWCCGIGVGVIVLALISIVLYFILRKPPNRLTSSIKWSIDPCEDFHEHACGNWVRPLLDTGQKDTLSSAALVNSKAFEHGLDLIASNKTDTNSRSVKYVTKLISDCKKVDKVALEPLKSALRELAGEQWPLAIVEQEGQNSDEWTDLFARYYSMAGQAPFFNIQFFPHEDNVQVKKIMFLPSNPPNGEDKLKLMGYLHVLLQLPVDQLGQNNLKLIDEELQFEKELGKLMGFGMKNTTLAHLTSQSGGVIDFVKLFNKIAQLTKADFEFAPNDAVTLMFVGGQHYWSQLGKLILKTPIRVWKNFFGWYYLYNHAFFGRELAKVAYGQDYEKEMKKVCALFGTIGKQLGTVVQVPASTKYIISRIYLEGLIADGGIDKLREIRTKVTEMVAHLKDAFRDMLTGNEWLDGQTRTKALDKLTAMKEAILYSDWIMDDSRLDKWHGMLNFEDFDFDSSYLHDGFFERYQKWTRHMTAKLFRDYRKPLQVEEWQLGLFAPNAFYSPTENKINILTGYVQYPNFDLSEPDSINYGKTGAVIGHEITHGFDNKGSQYDRDGNKANWWSESSSARFNELAQCFVEQYSNITVQRTDQKIDGNQTLGENIADNGGVKEAFLAFTKHTQDSARTMVKLPDSKMTYANFTDEQLFFYAYAQNFCEVLTKDEASALIKVDIHSWFKYRVNVVLGNMEQFASTFNCPRGSVMNPAKKCAVW